MHPPNYVAQSNFCSVASVGRLFLSLPTNTASTRVATFIVKVTCKQKNVLVVCSVGGVGGWLVHWDKVRMTYLYLLDSSLVWQTKPGNEFKMTHNEPTERQINR